MWQRSGSFRPAHRSLGRKRTHTSMGAGEWRRLQPDFSPLEGGTGSAMDQKDKVSKLLGRKGSEVYAVSPEASVFEAVEVLSNQNIGALLVMEGETLVGIFSERDYARKVVLKGKSSRQTPVKEIMITPVITVSPDQSIEECMKIMTKSRIRHLPVLDSRKVVGVLSIGDLVNWIITAHEQTINHLEGYIAGRYPG